MSAVNEVQDNMRTHNKEPNLYRVKESTDIGWPSCNAHSENLIPEKGVYIAYL